MSLPGFFIRSLVFISPDPRPSSLHRAKEFFEGRDQSFRALRLTRDDLTITFEDIREWQRPVARMSCAANIVVRASDQLMTNAAKSDVVKAVSVLGLDKGVRAPITYDLTTTDDGRIYAEVWGLNGRR